jgi:hypothetical protein
MNKQSFSIQLLCVVSLLAASIHAPAFAGRGTKIFTAGVIVGALAHKAHVENPEVLQSCLDAVTKNLNELKDSIINSVGVKAPGASEIKSETKNEAPAVPTPVEDQTSQENNEK